MELIFATHNNHKLIELANIMPKSINLLSLDDLNLKDEIPETGNTLNDNALIKAQFVHKLFGKNCFADDTGLEVSSLSNEPGVFSARYAGEDKNADKNMQKLLFNLQNSSQREAKFRTVIALILDGKEYLFEGSVEGVIAHEKSGLNGFGYDPIFIPNGYTKSFAELSLNEKNQISHRAKAVTKLIDFLNQYNIK